MEGLKGSWLRTLQGKAAEMIWLSISSLAALLGARYGEEMHCVIATRLGQQLSGAAVCFLLATCAFLLFEVIRLRRKKTVFDRLVPVKGKGYSLDPKTGEAACPRCTSEKQAVFMTDRGTAYYCYVCNQGVLK